MTKACQKGGNAVKIIPPVAEQRKHRSARRPPHQHGAAAVEQAVCFLRRAVVKAARGSACRKKTAAPPFVRGRHLSFFAETKAAERLHRSGRPVCGPALSTAPPASSPPAAAVRERGQRRFCRFSLTEKFFSFFSRTIDFCAAQGFILFSAEKSGASPNEACASAALYAGCKYKAFARPFCGARKGRKHKKSHLPLGVPLAEGTNAGNSHSE